MKRAILHIGTEKTGSTSVQQFLFQNRSALEREGCLFPASAGYLSNHKLVVYAKRDPEDDLLSMSFDGVVPETLSDWKENFVLEHCREVLPFLKTRLVRRRTVVYSSEHLQSRLTTQDEISRVARLLRPLFDRIDVVVYLRRQDKLALSAHSTSMRGGASNTFSFSTINAAGPYYNHLKLLQDWSAVFGQENIIVRLFDRDRLVGGDVVRDFISTTGAGLSLRAPVYPEIENEALSWTAQEILRHHNALADSDRGLDGLDRARFTVFFLEALQRIEDSFGKVLPPRSEAQAFMRRFEEDNVVVANTWLAGAGFGHEFGEYPDSDQNLPVVDDVATRYLDIVTAVRASASRKSA